MVQQDGSAFNPPFLDWSVRSETLKNSLGDILMRGVSEGVLPGGVVMVSQGESSPVVVAAGRKVPGEGNSEGEGDRVLPEAVFDLGEVTRSLCTASIVMRLASSGKISVHDRASRFLQPLGIGQKSRITLAHLLAETAGLPAGFAVYDDLVRANAGPRPGILSSSGAKQFAYNLCHSIPLRYEPGARHVASAVNGILLGEICEIITGLSLDKAFFKLVAAPLQLKSLGFIDLTLLRRKNITPVVEIFAPAGECPRRGRRIVGEVWDEDTWAMGGISGQNGLFGVAADVHTWGRELVRAYGGKSSFVKQDVVRTVWNPEAQQGGGIVHKLGFETPTKEGGFVDGRTSPDAVVASSATGCSVLMDPSRELVVVFLSNASFMGQLTKRFHALRSELHSAVIETI